MPLDAVGEADADSVIDGFGVSVREGIDLLEVKDHELVTEGETVCVSDAENKSPDHDSVSVDVVEMLLVNENSTEEDGDTL